MADAHSLPSAVPVPGPTAFSLVAPPTSTVPPPVLSDPALSSYVILRFSALQLTCPSVSEMSSSPPFSLVFIPFRESPLHCDISLGSLCPLVPLELIQDLFEFIHISSQPGVQASRRLISAFFVWPRLSRDLGLWARACLCCQWSKIQTYVHSSVPAIHVPSRRFSHVHLDLMGPLPSRHGFTYILTMTDRTTQWP